MPNRDEYVAIPLCDCRFLEPQLMHLLKGCIQSFSHILIRRVRKLIEQPHDGPVARKPFCQDVLHGHMRWQSSRALNLNSIIKYSNVHVIGDAVVAVNDGVSDDLVQRFPRILDLFKAVVAHPRNAFRDFDSHANGLLDLLVEAPFDRDRVEPQHIPETFSLSGLVAIHLDSTPLWEWSLWFFCEEQYTRN